jgi:hypothetical protein
MGKRRRKSNGPPPVSEADCFEGEVGPPIYEAPMPPVKTRLRLLAGGKTEIIDTPSPPACDVATRVGQTDASCDVRPLVPASEEVAKLPRGAREAFALRCAARVARLRAGATSPEAAAALILAAATVTTPIRRQLLCIRRDFDQLVTLAKKHGWTDDTPVPPDVFGPMWPKNHTPQWAAEPPAADASGK